MIKNMTDENGRFLRHETDMSDMKNWLCVHVTKYKPKRNKNGELYINATGPATSYKYPRATVHFTLNQIVSSHLGGNWDNTPFVILAPYNDVVEKNGNPQVVATEDTYFIPNPDTGLILPKSAHIIKPNNDTLFNIGENVSTYKTDKLKTILPFVDSWDRENYEKYDKCDLTEAEIDCLFCFDNRIKKIYEKIKDKHAFLHGILSESRNVILTRFLREIVTREAMKNMGYNYVEARKDDISALVANVARSKGIKGDSGNNGHSNSLESYFENIGCSYQGFVEILQKQNIGDVYSGFVDGYWREYGEIFLHNEKLDLYQKYEEYFACWINRIRCYADNDLRDAKENNNDVRYAEVAKKVSETLAYADRLEQGGIKAYNPHLDTVLHRNAARLESEYSMALKKLKENPNYPLLRQMVMDLPTGKQWYKTPFGNWESYSVYGVNRFENEKVR